MVVIRCMGPLKPEEAVDLLGNIHAQARDGIVVLPACCELLAVDNGGEVQIIQGNAESTRVAELEKELAVAMRYISACKDCETCKHEMRPGATCPCDCNDCGGGPCNGICKTCHNGSNWEWRGAHEPV